MLNLSKLGVSGMYSNLFTKNVSYGGGKREEGDISKLDLARKRKEDFVNKME